MDIFCTGDETISSPNGVNYMYAPKAVSDRPAGLGFYTVRGDVDLVDLGFCRRFIGFSSRYRSCRCTEKF